MERPSINMRYFAVNDAEGLTVQAVKLVEVNGDTSEQEEMRAAFTASGLTVQEIDKGTFYFILAEAGIKTVRPFFSQAGREAAAGREFADESGKVAGRVDNSGFYRPNGEGEGYGV